MRNSHKLRIKAQRPTHCCARLSPVSPSIQFALTTISVDFHSRGKKNCVELGEIEKNNIWLFKTNHRSHVLKKKKQDGGLSRHKTFQTTWVQRSTIPLTSSSVMHVLKTLILHALAFLMEPNIMARWLVVLALPSREEWPRRVKISRGANALLSAAGWMTVESGGLKNNL